MKDFTPTVGLGCRSGGYSVYLVLANGLLATELLVWWLTHQTTCTLEDLLAKMRTKLKRRTLCREPFEVDKKSRMQQWEGQFLSWLKSNTFRDVMRKFVLRPGEFINTVWLIYIIMAQSVYFLIQYLKPRDALLTSSEQNIWRLSNLRLHG